MSKCLQCKTRLEYLGSTIPSDWRDSFEVLQENGMYVAYVDGKKLDEWGDAGIEGLIETDIARRASKLHLKSNWRDSFDLQADGYEWIVYVEGKEVDRWGSVDGLIEADIESRIKVKKN